MNWLISKKNLVTDILGFCIAAVGIIDSYMANNAGQKIDWVKLGIALVTGAVAYFTGKGKVADGK